MNTATLATLTVIAVVALWFLALILCAANGRDDDDTHPCYPE